MTPLSDLTDADVILNLYLSVIMALHVTDADAATVLMDVTRLTDTDTTPTQTATLEDLMTEVERRLGMEPPELIDQAEGRMQ